MKENKNEFSYDCKTNGKTYTIPINKQTIKERDKMINSISPLKIKQKIIKLSRDRLGIYLNKDIVRSLNLKHGQSCNMFVNSKKEIIIELL